VFARSKITAEVSLKKEAVKLNTTLLLLPAAAAAAPPAGNVLALNS
jgi:hypothetical protein